MKQTLRKGFKSPWKLANLAPKTPILLALSGGADSRALLQLLVEEREKNAFPLYLAHVNHGIRGKEADRDQQFCEELAERYGLPIFVKTVDVPRLAKETGTGLEETAREVRYAWFSELMHEHRIPILVTAHHADDNLETFLFRLFRGSGTRGLCGIVPTRSFGEGTLVRPLLTCTRREILAFCEDMGLEYVTDSTNADTVYTRNRLRADVVPILEELFEAPQKKAADAMVSMAEDEACLSQLAYTAYREAFCEDGLSCERLQILPTALCKRVLIRWAETYTGRLPERVHVEAMRALLDGNGENAEVALPADHLAVCECGRLRILRKQRAVIPMDEIPFCEGETLFLEDRVRITVKKSGENTNVHNLSTQSYIILKLHSAIINNSLYWRTLREGDRLFRGGMHKKLRKLYSEAKIPPHRRDQMPVLCDGEGILWAPFIGPRDGMEAGDTACLVGVELLSLETAFAESQRNGGVS